MIRFTQTKGVNRILTVLVGIAMISDAYKREISNRLILLGIIYCFVKALGSFHILSIFQVIFNLSIPVIALYPLYLMRAVGAADVKLISMISGFTGIIFAGKVALLSLILGAAWSLILLIQNRALVQNLCFALGYAFDLIRGSLKPYPQDDPRREDIKMPLSVCIGTALFTLQIVERM